jgi:putative flavoprotein involved in K+ transport
MGATTAGEFRKQVMHYVPVVIIGAGQAGLAMSHCLTQRRIEHVVLERGRIAERWRSERWDSLRLLTPNWMTRLPGWSYDGDDPDGYMTAPEFVRYLADYAGSSDAPIKAGTTVLSVRATPFGYRVETNWFGWETRAVVIATGQCDVPRIPEFAQRLPAWLHQMTPSEYRNPRQLPEGGVLVVGASATGVQLAAEIRQSGRDVVLSAGRHTRLPRRYRGRDTWWWLERIGVLDEATDEVSDLQRARALPSFQLVGGPDGRTIDLGTLRDAGVRILGRAIGAEGRALHLRDDLAETTGAAQAALERLLARIDIVADASGAPPATDAMRTLQFGASPTAFDLGAEGIRTVLWATGYRRDYSWLKVPVLDVAGEICHDGGITPSPGLYVLGLNFLRRRRSHFIDGVGFDAAELAQDIQCHLAVSHRAVA